MTPEILPSYREERDVSIGCTGVVGCIGVREEHNEAFS